MELRGIDLNLIVALRALLLHRNVTRAAKEVGLSQSSMSHALSRLRAHFDDPLLVPVGRQLVLTERAKGLIAPVSDAAAHIGRVFAPVEPFDPKTSRRTFRIASTDNLELYVLPKLAASLSRTAPGIDIRVSALPVDWTASLERGDIELKLGRKYALPAGLEGQDLGREQLWCVARRGYRTRAKPTLREYAGLDHLVVTPTARVGSTVPTPIDEVLAKHGLSRRIAMTVPHFLVAPFIVARSDLVLTAPGRLLEPFLDSLPLRKLELPLKLGGYTLSQVWAERSRNDEAHRWLRGEIARTFT